MSQWPGRGLAYQLARIGKEWRAAAAVRMPEARGDIREIVGEPVFVPLQKLAAIYGGVGAVTPSHLHNRWICEAALRPSLGTRSAFMSASLFPESHTR
jgi:hypothetical protein